MAECYGRRLTSQYGVEPPLSWITCFQGYTDNDLTRGWAVFLQDENSKPPEARGWPPTRAELQAAIARPRWAGHRLGTKALPAPKAREEIVNRCREQLRRMGYLGGTRANDEHENEAIG